MRFQEPVAETVDRRDPRAVEIAREIVAAPIDERRPDPRAQLARRLARVRDDEDGVDVEPALADRADVALDEDRGLSGARSGRYEHRAAGLGRGELLVVQPGPALDDDRHGRATRHIVHRSHQAGHSRCFGSWSTSPARIRCAFVEASPRAAST